MLKWFCKNNHNKGVSLWIRTILTQMRLFINQEVILRSLNEGWFRLYIGKGCPCAISLRISAVPIRPSTMNWSAAQGLHPQRDIDRTLQWWRCSEHCGRAKPASTPYSGISHSSKALRSFSRWSLCYWEMFLIKTTVQFALAIIRWTKNHCSWCAL